VSGISKGLTRIYQICTVQITELVFICFLTKTTLPKVLCANTDCHDAQSTCPAKYLVFFNQSDALNLHN
jgi:hypothetical protein